LSGCASFLGLPGQRLDTGFGLGPNSGKLRQPTQKRVFRLAKTKAQQARLAFRS